ncbi:unnamed protein product [Didymodactylos carnosus]|uniref:Ricin B lectin domain-containing protein n=1 Tax=Didymodactylos carnosus TaxID=1234261 RepID=A0A814QJF1_9BILA|nr:unnamed protein product [Didymodactylos carnosus]CAF1478439.1 unnamed protein product [Didymodactylos carnosus]CAF3885001.1 unnamed protein product [Didymodactylos carnosus]CAF4269262.1 unnamed protein product [Didymodactylos carnosus]
MQNNKFADKAGPGGWNDLDSTRSAFDGRCLSIESCSTTEVASIVINECHIGDSQAQHQGKNQQWTAVISEQTIVYLMNGQRVNVPDYDESSVDAFSYNKQDNQAWTWNAADGLVRSKYNGQCLTVGPELDVWGDPLSDAYMTAGSLRRREEGEMSYRF